MLAVANYRRSFLNSLRVFGVRVRRRDDWRWPRSAVVIVVRALGSDVLIRRNALRLLRPTGLVRDGRYYAGIAFFSKLTTGIIREIALRQKSSKVDSICARDASGGCPVLFTTPARRAPLAFAFAKTESVH